MKCWVVFFFLLLEAPVFANAPGREFVCPNSPIRASTTGFVFVAQSPLSYSVWRSAYADLSTLRIGGVGGLLAMKYEQLEDSVGTSDIVRAVDSGGEYSGWERFGYGVRGAVKTAMCIAPAFRGAPAAKGGADAAAEGLANNEIVVIGNSAKPGNFILRPGIDTKPIGAVTQPGISASIATDLTLEGEFSQMFGRSVVRGDTLSGSFVGDIRAAGFDVVRAPTANNPLHVRIISGENTFDAAGRDWLSTAFDRLARAKKSQ